MTGIPILAVAIVILVRAYSKVSETYRQITIDTQAENDRLRKIISGLDSDLALSRQKVKEAMEQSGKAIEKLQAKQLTINEKETFTSSEEILSSEREKLKEIIEKLHDLRSGLRRMELESKHVAMKLTEDYESAKNKLAEISATIEDPKIKVIVLDVLQQESDLSEARDLLEKGSSKLYIWNRNQVIKKNQ